MSQLADAFTVLINLQGRPMTLKRLGSPDIEMGVKAAPALILSRHVGGPDATIVEGEEFIVPESQELIDKFVKVKRGDRLVDPVRGTFSIITCVPCYDIGGGILGYRCRTE